MQLLKVALIHLGSICRRQPSLMQQLLAPLASELLDPQRTVAPDVRKNVAAALQAGICAACASAEVRLPTCWMSQTLEHALVQMCAPLHTLRTAVETGLRAAGVWLHAQAALTDT